MTNRSRIQVAGTSPSRTCSPRALPSSRRERRHARLPAADPGVDPAEQLAQGQHAVTLEDAQPHRVPGGAPERQRIVAATGRPRPPAPARPASTGSISAVWREPRAAPTTPQARRRSRRRAATARPRRRADAGRRTRSGRRPRRSSASSSGIGGMASGSVIGTASAVGTRLSRPVAAGALTRSAGTATVGGHSSTGPRPRRRPPLPCTEPRRMTHTEARPATAARRHARRQPGGRARQPRRLRRGQGLPAPQGHRPRRVLGRQRPPGGRLLPRAVGFHPGRVRGPRDRRPRPGELRDAAARHPDRPDRPLTRTARSPSTSASTATGSGHRVRVPDVALVPRDDGARRARGPGAGRARRRRGRRPAPERRLDVRRRAPLVRRPARLPRRVRAGYRKVKNPAPRRRRA